MAAKARIRNLKQKNFGNSVVERRNVDKRRVKMLIQEAILILGGQALMLGVVAVILYRQLNSKLEKTLAFAVSELKKKPRKMATQIFINTLPKVGSKSVFHMLRRALPEAIVEHGHFISYEGQLAAAQDLERIMAAQFEAEIKKQIPRMMAVRQDLDGLLGDPHLSSYVYFICGTREPLGWALSTLFQLIEATMLPASYSESSSARQVIMGWLSGSPPMQWLPSPQEWIKREIEGYLGFDWMTKSFDHAAGYQIFDTKRGRLLLFRLENFHCIPKALGELLQAPAHLFGIARANTTIDKQIGPAYGNLVKTLRFPRSFVEKVYNDPYAVTFYSPEERRELITRWSE